MERELAALKFLDGLGGQLRNVREPRQSLRLTLRGAREFFEADQSCIAVLEAGRPHANLLITLPRRASWDLDALTRFIRHEHPPVRPHMLLGPVRRRGGAWGAIAVMREQRPFDREDGRLLVRIAAGLSDAIHQIDRETVVNGLAICCRYVPCAQLGGDLYDYAAVESGETALLVADVCGHGVSAAMLTGVVKSAFHAARADRFDPLAVVHRVWHALSPFSAQRFVTLFTALVAPAVRQLRYVNAGHPSIPLWSGGREPVWLESTGPLISPVLTPSWDARTVPVDQGAQLLLYTDGVSEPLADADGCAKGRIQSSIEEHVGGGAQLLDAIVDGVRRALAGRAQSDDLTLLTARVLGSGQSAMR